MFRFRKLKEEEESRRKEVLGQARESEQSSTESRVLDGAQNLDVSSGNNKDGQVQGFFFVACYMVYFSTTRSRLIADNSIKQEPHENGSVVANNNGGLDHSRNVWCSFC